MARSRLHKISRSRKFVTYRGRIRSQFIYFFFFLFFFSARYRRRDRSTRVLMFFSLVRPLHIYWRYWRLIVYLLSRNLGILFAVACRYHGHGGFSSRKFHTCIVRIVREISSFKIFDEKSANFGEFLYKRNETQTLEQIFFTFLHEV